MSRSPRDASVDVIDRGRALTLVAVAALLIVAISSRRVSPPLHVSGTVHVVLTAALGLYLYFGYRGVRWLLAGLALLTVLGLVPRLFGMSWSGAAPFRSLAMIFLSLGSGVLVLGRPVAEFAVHQRRNRTPEVGQGLTVIWILVLAALAVWLWARAAGAVL